MDASGEPAMTSDKSGPPSRFRNIVLQLSLATGSVLVVLFVVEIVLRITTPKEIMRYFFVAPDRTLHHRFMPNASGRYRSTEFNTEYRINSLGLRDREFPVEKPPQTVRVLMLGDSFTEGDGVESNETFSKLIEAQLRSAVPGNRVEVINAGVGSYSPILEYLYLKTEGLRLNPDLVVLNLDLSDFYDDINYSMLATLDSAGVPLGVSPGGTPEEEHGIATKVKDFFKDHTRIYNFIRLRINRYIEGVRHEGNFTGDLRYDKYAMLRDNHATADDSEWSLSYRYLLLIRDFLRDRGIDLWITVYPYGQQVSPKEWNVGRRFWGFKPDTLYSIQPQGFVEAFCVRSGIHVVNMCQQMRDSSRTVFPLYLSDNGHWTPRGHEVVAAILKSELEPYLRNRFASARKGEPVTESSTQGRN